MKALSRKTRETFGEFEKMKLIQMHRNMELNLIDLIFG